jgi:hypothetical protein
MTGIVSRNGTKETNRPTAPRVDKTPYRQIERGIERKQIKKPNMKPS